MRDTVKRKGIGHLQKMATERSTPKPAKKKRAVNVPRVTKGIIRRVLKVAREKGKGKGA